ncbi:MAG TPA: hypothetical protein VFW00_07475, partial [Rhodocyclaceae bacterium]|nr:hypothetical protein [Rhodocyclaceae bacterium]
GRVIQAFVDDNPPEPFTRVRDGGDYGWPFCNPNQHSSTGFFDMPFDRDAQLNPDGAHRDCEKLDHISLGLPAHTAPLGMSFLHNSKLPAPWQQGAVIGLHGCWNCSKLNGNKVVFVPFSADGKPAEAQDMITGWIINAKAKTRWGRPVDAVPSGHGTLLISDDYSGTIYELYPR